MSFLLIMFFDWILGFTPLPLANILVEEAYKLLSSFGYEQILTQLLNGLVAALKKNDEEKIFHSLKGVIDLPDYSDVITQPICLSTIHVNVTKSQYKTLEEFKQDVSGFIT